MRSFFIGLLIVGTTACLRASTTDPDASSNGNSNGNGNNNSDADNGNNGSNGNTTPDAGNGNHTDAGNGSNGGTPDAAMSGPPCKNKVSSVGSGHHNAGTDCMNSCHNHGFTLAGTLYSSANGGSAISGASITVKDAAGHTFDIVSQLDGNFYTSNSVQFPVTVYASECQISQTSEVMTDPVTSTQRGGCNATGCHTTSAQGRIHLP
jgi:hypothetical protein